MKIKLREMTIQDVVVYNLHDGECTGYSDKGESEEGVYGCEGRLNIRPSYQRNFIYKDAQRNDVINSIRHGYPLNVLYWIVNADGNWEVLDGQQRLISIGQYVSGDFSIKDLYFHNLAADQQKQILNYKLMVYLCKGTDSEILDWFRIVNIAGEKLSSQELRNAIYAGPWVSDAKRYFSKSGCPAYQVASEYLKGSSIRQSYLETAIKWRSNNSIEACMAEHQYKKSAKELWNYFETVIEWVQKLFPTYKKEMKGVPWGLLYNEFGGNKYSPDGIETEVGKLMQDDDVTKKAGIYSYIFSRSEKELSIRAFIDSNKREAYERQKGVCAHCKETYGFDEMEADHIIPWSKGGKTVPDNCQMLCVPCNREKGAKLLSAGVSESNFG